MMEYKVIQESNGDGGSKAIEIRCVDERAPFAFVRVELKENSVKFFSDEEVEKCEYEGNRGEYGMDEKGNCKETATHRLTICDAPELQEKGVYKDEYGESMGPDESVYCRSHAALYFGLFAMPDGSI